MSDRGRAVKVLFYPLIGVNSGEISPHWTHALIIPRNCYQTSSHWTIPIWKLDTRPCTTLFKGWVDYTKTYQIFAKNSHFTTKIGHFPRYDHNFDLKTTSLRKTFYGLSIYKKKSIHFFVTF